MKKPLLAILTAGSAVALLAGCTAGSSNDGKPEPTASASAASAPESGMCVDGAITVTEADLTDGALSITECAQVYLLTNDAEITVSGVAKIGAEGARNTITYIGNAPELTQMSDDAGNTLVAAE